MVTRDQRRRQRLAPVPRRRADRRDPAGQQRRPRSTGTPKRGLTLTTNAGSWSGIGNSYTYQWQRDAGSGFTDIPGATAHTYVLTAADTGALIRSRVTATNPDAVVPAYSLALGPVTASGPVNTALPTVSGTARRTAVPERDDRHLERRGEHVRLPVAARRGRSVPGHPRGDGPQLHAGERRPRRHGPRRGDRDQPGRDGGRGVLSDGGRQRVAPAAGRRAGDLRPRGTGQPSRRRRARGRRPARRSPTSGSATAAQASPTSRARRP